MPSREWLSVRNPSGGFRGFYDPGGWHHLNRLRLRKLRSLAVMPELAAYDCGWVCRWGALYGCAPTCEDAFWELCQQLARVGVGGL